MNKTDLVKYLNDYLKIDNFAEDNSKNGLQVDNSRQEIKKIWYAVDATSYIFDKAIAEWVDMLIVHHGMYRWFESVMTELHYLRIKKLLNSDISLYACHLPLDAHEEVGNNIVLLNKFVNYFHIKKFEIIKKDHSFGLKFVDNIFYEDISNYCKNIWIVDQNYNFWNKKEINSVFFSSGGWLFLAKMANELNYDLLITWEWAHHDISMAKDIKQSVLLWWHYETEIFGVQALAEKLNEKFGIDIVFLDEKY